MAAETKGVATDLHHCYVTLVDGVKEAMAPLPVSEVDVCPAAAFRVEQAEHLEKECRH